MKDGDDLKVVEIKGLKYTYPDGTVALKDINLDIEKGKKVAILGSNGSGKSTLLQHLNGLIIPQEGRIKINGIEVNKENLNEIRRKLGFVFDNPDNQLFATTVFEDVAFGPRNLKLEESVVFNRVDKVLSIVGIKELMEKQPHNLSLGQKRKAAIAGVLAMEPEVLVFDEPFSGLDPISLTQFLETLDKLYKLNHSLIITTHDVDIAYSWADEIVIINNGKILKQGDISLLEDKELLKIANLKLPTLYEIFSNTNIRVRNIEDAKEKISIILSD